jgi:hypothetical protein
MSLGYIGYDLFEGDIIEEGDTWAILADVIKLYQLKYGLDTIDATKQIRRDVLALGGTKGRDLNEGYWHGERYPWLLRQAQLEGRRYDDIS